ncbi:MAG: tetratricopeptide repeat protein [Spirochaetales bacterium]|nr:tetratricopeptide repeat protein [Spirochaetales bacterium]
MIKKSSFFLLFIVIINISLMAQEKKNALTLWRQSKFDEAVEVCLTELDTLPLTSFAERMDSYTVLCWSLLGLQRYEEVLKYGKEAYEKSSRDWRFVAALGEAHYFLGNNKESLYYLEKYIELKGTGDKADYMYYLMGHLFLRMEEYNRADVALSMAVYLKPLDAKWWARLGFAREQAKDYARAKDAYTKALSINSSLVDAERGIKRVHNSLGL